MIYEESDGSIVFIWTEKSNIGTVGFIPGFHTILEEFPIRGIIYIYIQYVWHSLDLILLFLYYIFIWYSIHKMLTGYLTLYIDRLSIYRLTLYKYSLIYIKIIYIKLYNSHKSTGCRTYYFSMYFNLYIYIYVYLYLIK